MNLPLIIHPEQNNALLKSKNISLCAFLDTARKRKDNTFTVRIRIIHERVPMFYTTKIYFSESQYLKLFEKSPKGEYRDAKILIYELLRKANDIICNMDSFNFKDFQKIWKGEKSSSNKDIKDFYIQAIEDFTKNNQLGTASNYQFSLKSLEEFQGNGKLQFKHITSQWLKDYERYMVEEKGRSKTTVSMYLRTLRTIFNFAISEKVVSPDTYPFGKRKYQVPAPKAVKKSLSSDELKKLFDSVAPTKEQQKAKDFFFFSYFCNGMNFKDIANLKYSDVTDDVITFEREKTKNTNRDQAPVIVYQNEFTISIIQKYGNPDKAPKNFVFPIVNPLATPIIQHKQLKNFVRFVNQHIKHFAKFAGINENISTYWARHSFATTALRKGASMEFISEALNHSDIKTTKNYFAGFTNDVKRDFAKTLMNF